MLDVIGSRHESVTPVCSIHLWQELFGEVQNLFHSPIVKRQVSLPPPPPQALHFETHFLIVQDLEVGSVRARLLNCAFFWGLVYYGSCIVA